MCLSPLQMNEKVSSQVPEFAVIRTRKKLAWVGPYVSEREVGIISLVVEFGRTGGLDIKASMCLRCTESRRCQKQLRVVVDEVNCG